MQVRVQRGALVDSLATARTVNNIEELRKYLNMYVHPLIDVDKGEIVFKYMGYDDRIQWETYYVLIDGKILAYSDNDKF